MPKRSPIDIPAEAKARLERVAQHFGMQQKWTVGRMVCSRTVEDWVQTIASMPPSDPDDNGNCRRGSAVATQDRDDGAEAVVPGHQKA